MTVSKPEESSSAEQPTGESTAPASRPKRVRIGKCLGYKCKSNCAAFVLKHRGPIYDTCACGHVQGVHAWSEPAE